MNVDQIVIRPVTAADAPSVGGIYAHYVRRTTATLEEVAPSEEDWRRRVATHVESGLPFLVADVCGEVGGYAYVSPWRPKPANRHTVEDSIYLAPEHTGRGLGGKLLDALLDACRAAGLRQVISVIADTGGGTSNGTRADTRSGTPAETGGGAPTQSRTETGGGTRTETNAETGTRTNASTGSASIALHRRCGFTLAGRLTGTGYKHGRWIDVVLMQRDLTP